MRFNHEELIARESLCPTGHKGGYSGYLAEVKALRDKFYKNFLDTRQPNQPSINETIAAFDAPPPEEFSAAYDLSPEDIAHLARSVQRKYVVRFKNIRRSWAILLQYMPELFCPDGPRQDVLEMSTAHGATLEVLGQLGHRAVGNDFANFLGRREADSRFRGVNELDLAQVTDDHGLNDGNGQIVSWPYEPIIRSLGLDVRLFDAGHVPYPFEEDRFDTVMCFDALEHYCHPRDWMTIISEFCRIARRSVLVITNPVQGHLINDASYMGPFYQFQKDMRHYRDAKGFSCVYAGVNRNQLTTFKLMRLPG